jgi:hypothetical protein
LWLSFLPNYAPLRVFIFSLISSFQSTFPIAPASEETHQGSTTKGRHYSHASPRTGMVGGAVAVMSAAPRIGTRQPNKQTQSRESCSSRRAFAFSFIPFTNFQLGLPSAIHAKETARIIVMER